MGIDGLHRQIGEDGGDGLQVEAAETRVDHHGLFFADDQVKIDAHAGIRLFYLPGFAVNLLYGKTFLKHMVLSLF